MIAYERTGAGPPLLLVHGLGSCKEMWRPVIPSLARERDVVALDLPGFGASPAGPTTVEGLAGAVADFAAGLGFERPHVAGNSMGGGIALALAASGRVASACAISPAGFFRGEREKAYSRGMLAVTRVLSQAIAGAADALTRPAPVRTATMAHIVARPWRLPPGEAAFWVRAYAKAPSFWPLLRSVPEWAPAPPLVPTTIAWGDRDRLLIHSRQAPRAARILPAARHVTLTGCGHVPTWDDPEQVARVILAAAS